MSTLARVYADYFVNHFCYENIPEKTRHNIKVLMMDYLGVATKGTTTATGKIAREYFSEKGGRAEARLFDSQTYLPAESAAFANAISSHSLEMDDIDRLAFFHFSPPIYSAALAVAEMTDADGKSLVTALAAGVEMMERLSLALNPGLRNRGFHTTPALGIFGATVACALLLGLSEEQLTNAFGLAGSQVAGMLEFYGESMQKRFNPGPAAHNAILAVRLAQKGFTGADTIFEGKRGICRAYSDSCDWSQLENPKQGDYVFEIELKPYACARPIHSCIDAALDLRRQLAEAGRGVEEIARVDVYRHPWWADYHTNQEPKTYHDAQTSMCFSVALAMVVGGNFFSDYLNAVENRNEAVFDLTKKVFSVCDEKFPNSTGCWALTTMKDGSSFRALATYPKGSVENPMTPEDRRNKFLRLAGFKFSEEQTAALAELIETLEEHSARELLDRING